MNTIFVYYKVQPNQNLLKINQFIQEISQKYPEINIELMKRPDLSSDGFETWLEVYQEVKQEIIQEFNENLNRAAVAHGLPSQRKVEVFVNALS